MDDILTIIGENWARIQALEVLIEWDFAERVVPVIEPSCIAPRIVRHCLRPIDTTRCLKNSSRFSVELEMPRCYVTFGHFGVHPYSIFHLTAARSVAIMDAPSLFHGT